LSAYFFDTSALVKRYVNETGSAWVDDLTDLAAGNDIYILRITEIEVTSAVTRRRRGGSLSVTDAATVLAQFRQDLANEYHVVEVTPVILAAAVSLVETHGLRAYDAVQLAAVSALNAYRITLSLSDLTLVSADQELNAAAATDGLTVEDPNAHP
jgi:predicted nucleic acid-binding protein